MHGIETIRMFRQVGAEGGGGATAGQDGNQAEAPEGGGTNPAATQDAGQAAEAAPAAGKPSTPWWQEKTFDGDREWLTARAFTDDDPLRALPKIVQMARNAEQKLGKGPEQLVQRPGKDQPLADYMRAHGDLFQVPEGPDGYKLERPDLGKGVEWDEKLEAAIRQAGYEAGVPGPALQAMTNAYAARIAEMVTAAEIEAGASGQEMMEELMRDWGGQADAKIARARSAFEHFAATAKLGPDAQQAMAQIMGGSAGNAGVVKLFAAIADAMGDDQMPASAGGSSFGVTPADARARIAGLRKEQGVLLEAGKARDPRFQEIERELDQLYKIASEGRAA